jgi:hypothetical protein
MSERSKESQRLAADIAAAWGALAKVVSGLAEKGHARHLVQGPVRLRLKERETAAREWLEYHRLPARIRAQAGHE